MTLFCLFFLVVFLNLLNYEETLISTVQIITCAEIMTSLRQVCPAFEIRLTPCPKCL